MGDPLTAHDLLPLVLKLTNAERLVLAKLALRSAAHDTEGSLSYRASPRTPGELSTEVDPLVEESEGWNALDAARAGVPLSDRETSIAKLPKQRSDSAEVTGDERDR